MQIDLQIGGQAVRLHEAEDRPAFLWPCWPFDLFFSDPANSETPPDIDIEVVVSKKLPELVHGNMIFDADHGLWKLYENGTDYYLETFDTKTHEPYTRSFISNNFGKIRLWFQESLDPLEKKQMGWIPAKLINPVLEICLLTRIAREGGVFLHASAVKLGPAAYVFSGPSGAGKSTIAELFVDRIDCPVLSDEKIILRRQAEQIMVYGTPWYGSSRRAANQNASLDRLFLISHGLGQHLVRPLSFLEWTRRFLRECSLPFWDRAGMEQTMIFLGDLSRQVECLELSFLKEPDVVEFLQEQVPPRPLSSSNVFVEDLDSRYKHSEMT